MYQYILLQHFFYHKQKFISMRHYDMEMLSTLPAPCIMKTHVRGFFDTDLHEVSWHFAAHEAIRPSGF